MPSDPSDVCTLSVTELATRIREGEVSPVTAVEAHLDHIAERDDNCNAFVTVTDDLARAAARETERSLADDADRDHTDHSADAPGPLHGVPIAIKDFLDLKEGVPNTKGCAALADERAERTTVAVQRLEAAGAVVLGTTNTPEVAHAGVTDNELVGPTPSPFDETRNAGGSSGGSAAAVASGMAPAALGSDAAGSIRIPAAACGVYGLKPSFGIVPIDDRPSAFGKKRHHVAKGPLTRTVDDAALLLDVMSGQHPRDPASVPVDTDFRGAVDRSIADLSVAYTPDMGVFDVDAGVAATVEDALSAFEAAGAAVTEVTVDHGHTMGELASAVETTFVTFVEDAVEMVEHATGVDLRETPVSERVRRQLAIAERTTTADLSRTGVERTDLFDALQDVFAEYDLLVLPTLGATPPLEPDADTYREWVGTQVLTWPFNWTGHPAASVPAGFADGRPVGMQLVGRRYDDETVLAASAAVERERPWRDSYPA